MHYNETKMKLMKLKLFLTFMNSLVRYFFSHYINLSCSWPWLNTRTIFRIQLYVDYVHQMALCCLNRNNNRTIPIKRQNKTSIAYESEFIIDFRTLKSNQSLEYVNVDNFRIDIVQFYPKAIFLNGHFLKHVLCSRAVWTVSG